MKKTRFIPYGYTIREGRTVIEHTEAEIIREIFDEYIKGASLKEIAESLTQRKIPYTEKTDTWDKARIARIIDNAKCPRRKRGRYSKRRTDKSLP